MKQNFDIRYFEVLDIDMQKSNQEHHFCISLPNNFWSTKLYRISDWRKGLAVAMYSSASYTNYFLVDKDYNIVFETFCSDESEIEEEQLVQLERIFGGYYVVRSVYSHCIATYPGQDRDTLYSYSIYIKDVLDENGVSLSKEKKDIILFDLGAKEIIELGDDVILRKIDNSIYRLSSFEFVSKLSIIPTSVSIFENGKCKLYVKNDFRDYYVIVNNGDIVKSYPKELLDEILNLVDVKLGEEKNSIVYPVDFNKVPSIECLINKYLFAIDSPATSLCNIYTLNNRTIQEIKKWYHFLYNQFTPDSEDYTDVHRYYALYEKELNELIDQLPTIKAMVPNFVEDVQFVKNVIFYNENCKLYLFRVRPFEYLDKNGIFDYTFSIEDIKL